MTDAVSLVAAQADYAIPLAAFIVSAAALVYGVFGTRQSSSSSLEQAMADRITDLTNQVMLLREENKECARRTAQLERENLVMLRQLAKLENGHHG